MKIQKNPYLFLALIAIGVLVLAIYANKPSPTANTITPLHHHTMVMSEEQFIAEMIPHHQEAVDTARIVLEKTENSETRELADAIIAAQTQEITMMKDWNAHWYPESTYKATYMNMMPPLNTMSEPTLDKAFLQGMIVHHQAAVMMAQQVLLLNPRPEVKTFAQDVIRVQTTEIAQMQELLKHY